MLLLGLELLGADDGQEEQVSEGLVVMTQPAGHDTMFKIKT